jgi:hypothetical protein
MAARIVATLSAAVWRSVSTTTSERRLVGVGHAGEVRDLARERFLEFRNFLNPDQKAW